MQRQCGGLAGRDVARQHEDLVHRLASLLLVNSVNPVGLDVELVDQQEMCRALRVRSHCSMLHLDRFAPSSETEHGIMEIDRGYISPRCQEQGDHVHARGIEP